jgi:CBS domain-containing protein
MSGGILIGKGAGMNVEQLMTRNVKVCTAGETLEAAAQRMWEYDVGCLPVRSGDGQVIGMLTDRDICMAAYTRGKTLSEIPVMTAMSNEVISCTEDDTIIQAEDLMRSHHVRRLPVRGAEGGVVGILSLSDIAREAEAELGRQGHQVSAEEVTATLAEIAQPRMVMDLVQTPA